jgi:hypothetical protein
MAFMEIDGEQLTAAKVKQLAPRLTSPASCAPSVPLVVTSLQPLAFPVLNLAAARKKQCCHKLELDNHSQANRVNRKS